MKLSDKVDVYSYGVVLLELLVGKHPLDPAFSEKENIVTWVDAKMREGNLDQIVDKNPDGLQ